MAPSNPFARQELKKRDSFVNSDHASNTWHLYYTTSPLEAARLFARETELNYKRHIRVRDHGIYKVTIDVQEVLL